MKHKPGDVLRMIYHGAPAALMTVTEVKNFSIKGTEGTSPCKVTFVPPAEFRFYAEIAPNRETILRNVRLVKITPEPADDFPCSICGEYPDTHDNERCRREYES